jgi:hypothetical protein
VEDIVSNDNHNVNWNYAGKADFLLGTGATQAEQTLVWIAGLAGVSLYGYLYLTHAFNWTVWQYLLAGVIAFDVVGGIVANSLNSCKRFYHSPAKPGEPRYSPLLRNHLAFAALHIYPLLVAVLYGTGNYFYGIAWYGFLVVGALIVLKAPLYLKRPLAFLLIAFALLINLYLIQPIHGFEWLVPALFIKILYGHLVPEEPYRPAGENAA